MAMLLVSAAAAALAPHVAARGAASGAGLAFPGWPEAFEGAAIKELPLSAREKSFARDFPGRIGRFTDGRREIILRFVAAPSRRLHPASDCFRGAGYSVTPRPLRRRSDGTTTSCFSAEKGADRLLVCEAIRSASGESWSDASAWYWHALFGRSAGPWWSEVVAEREGAT
jgi:hypothetical protein